MVKSIFVGLFRAARFLAVEFYYNWAMVYARWGMANRAMWYFNHAARVHPGGAKTFYQRGLLYVAIGSPESAVVDFTTAIKNDPGYTDAYMNRGMMYTLIGFHDAASKDFDHAASLGADRASLEQQAAHLLARTGSPPRPAVPSQNNSGDGDT